MTTVIEYRWYDTASREIPTSQGPATWGFVSRAYHQVKHKYITQRAVNTYLHSQGNACMLHKTNESDHNRTTYKYKGEGIGRPSQEPKVNRP